MGKAQKTWRFYRAQRSRILGSICILFGLALTVLAGLWRHPNATELLLLLAVTASFQIAGGAAVGRIGHVDAQKAKGAVRTLLDLGFSTRDIRAMLNEGSSIQDVDQLRTIIAVTEQAVSMMSRTVATAIEDWKDVHPEALQDVLTETGQTSNDSIVVVQ